MKTSPARSLDLQLKCIECWALDCSNLPMRNACATNSNLREVAFQRQVPLPVEYKGVKLDCGYRLDLIVQDEVILELKCVEQLLPVDDAQLLTYPKANS